jgi:hypothetical protein
MATSSRQANIFGVNDWKAIYKTFSQADFQSYDYETLRKSFVDYLRAYYPETFNDYIESSEYVALLDVIAFMGQALAFRTDLNARENFIDTAERRDSVIKLANLVGYNPKRSTAGQGYLKISSIQTTENVGDINGLNLSGISVIWNDAANPNWQEQFNAVLNAALISTQKIGRPGNSQTMLGIKNDEYSIQIPQTVSPVIPFTATIEGNSTSFELVSVTSIGKEFMYEPIPLPRGKFNFVYRNDGLGYGSANTGFFIYFKQGALNTFNFTLAQKISNQVVDVTLNNINDEDTWLLAVDGAGELIEWMQVENIYSNQFADYTGADKKVFSVKSQSNDQVSYVFGDGVFGEIPVGNYRALVRTGNALQYTIDPSEIQGTTVNINYVSKYGRTETLTVNLELTTPINNAQARESLSNIKLRAPTKYYTQNRMVNGEDYNSFPHTLYGSIIKSKALNRSSVGVSKNYDLLDPTGKYSTTKSFGSDGAFYQRVTEEFVEVPYEQRGNGMNEFLTSKLPFKLASHRSVQYYNQFYPKYQIGDQFSTTTPTWKQVSYNDSSYITGYFKQKLEGVDTPIAVSRFASTSMKYIETGALVRFTSPDGFYFDEGRLVAGIPPLGRTTSIWTRIENVVEDGFNGGRGALYNGLGPITLANNIPTGAILAEILPVFVNRLSSKLIQNILTRTNAEQSFLIQYNNSTIKYDNVWEIKPYDANDKNWFLKFESTGDGNYLITNRSVKYYFGSVRDTRFTFDKNKVIYDPLSGKTLRDTITILPTNSLPKTYWYTENKMFNEELTLAVVDQTIEVDGYPDDFSVEVTSFNVYNNRMTIDPGLFAYATGYEFSKFEDLFVFFRIVTDANLLSKSEIVPSSKVEVSCPTVDVIELNKYEYPIGQIFFATSEKKFYRTFQDSTSQNILIVKSVEDYYYYNGRQGIYFNYTHNSGNTTRINPSTTNIIDMYLVPQAYYTSYINWLKDTSGMIKEPTPPNINDLRQVYSKIEDYKMLSDSVILNSVKFKPLFGAKASPMLQANIKVIKNSKTTVSDSEVKVSVINAMADYFDISNWDFGDTFHFSELASYLHNKLGDFISAVVLVPKDPKLKFGDLYEIRSAPYEIFVNAAQASDIQVVTALSSDSLTSGK